jgi:hypothetical protein
MLIQHSVQIHYELFYPIKVTKKDTDNYTVFD